MSKWLHAAGIETCTVEGCVYPIHAKGFCGAHYQRNRTHGSPHIVLKKQPRRGVADIPPCTVEGCAHPIHAKMFCEMHYRRYRTHGSPHIVLTKKSRRWRANTPPRTIEQSINPKTDHRHQQERATNMRKKKAKPVTLDFPLRYEIMEALKQVFAKDEAAWKDGKKIAIYAAGASDATVASGMGFECKPSNVASIRVVMFGDLRAPRVAATKEKLADLQAQIDELREVVTAPAGETIDDAVIANLRQVIAGLTQKVERLRKLVETTSAKQFERQQSVKEKVSELLVHGPVRREVVLKTLCSYGFDDDDLNGAAVLLGCTVNKRANGEFISLPDAA